MVQTRTTPRCFGDHGLTTPCRTAPSPIDHDDMARIARALAHPARIEILEQFVNGTPIMTKELVAQSGLASSTMSQHLRMLREAGLIVARHDGPCIWYCLCGTRLADFARSVDRLVPKEVDDKGLTALS